MLLLVIVSGLHKRYWKVGLNGGFDSQGKDASQIDDTGAANTNESHESKGLLKERFFRVKKILKWMAA